MVARFVAVLVLVFGPFFFAFYMFTGWAGVAVFFVFLLFQLLLSLLLEEGE